MLRLAVCDDSPLFLQEMKEMLEADKRVEVTVVYENPEKLLEEIESEKKTFDAVFMDIELDSENQVVTKAGKEVELMPKEFELLEILMRNRNITLFRERIYEEIWGTEYSVESRTLDLHIQRLRKKLNLGAELKTVFKAGYRLEDKA